MDDEKPKRRVLPSRARPMRTTVRLTKAAHQEVERVGERTGLRPAILIQVAVQEFLVRQRHYEQQMLATPPSI